MRSTQSPSWILRPSRTVTHAPPDRGSSRTPTTASHRTGPYAHHRQPPHWTVRLPPPPAATFIAHAARRSDTPPATNIRRHIDRLRLRPFTPHGSRAPIALHHPRCVQADQTPHHAGGRPSLTERPPEAAWGLCTPPSVHAQAPVHQPCIDCLLRVRATLSNEAVCAYGRPAGSPSAAGAPAALSRTFLPSGSGRSYPALVSRETHTGRASPSLHGEHGLGRAWPSFRKHWRSASRPCFT